MALGIGLGMLSLSTLAQTNTSAQPSATADCTVSALNRSAPLQSDYSFTIYNLPGAAAVTGSAALNPPPPPPFRVRVTCSDGTVGETDLAFPEFGSTVVYTGEIYWRPATPIPIGLSVAATAKRLMTGQTTQLKVTGVLPNATTVDLSRRDKGTLFTSSNPLIASVDENGQITVNAGFSSGSSSRIIMGAQNEGVQATTVLQLGQRGNVSGHVYRADGVTPVVGAQVTVLRAQPRETVATVTTDAAGAFTVADVTAGQFSLSVIELASGDRGLGVAAIQNEGETTQVSVRLNGQGAVTVKVVDGTGAPLANAPVTLTSLSAFQDIQSATTDAAGVALFSKVLAGPIALSTRDKATGLVGTAAAQLAVGAAIVVPIKLQPVAAVQGTVFASDGVTPVEGVQVRLVSQMRGIVTQVVTGTDGKFRLEPLPLADAPFILDAMQDGRLKARVPGVIPASGGQVLTQNLVFAAAGTVTGTLRGANGTVVSGATVTLQSLVGQRLAFTAKTNSQGVYLIDGVPMGAFGLTAVAAEGETASGGGNLTRDAEVVVVDMQLAANGLVGTVYQRDGVTAVGAGVSVKLQPSGLTTQTNAAGQFGFTLSQPNNYVIEAADEQGNRGSTSVVVTTINPQSPTTVKVVYLARGALHGTVRDATGTAQAGVTVSLNSASLFGGRQTTTTDAAGKYRFADVFVGNVSVFASNSATKLSGSSASRLSEEGQDVALDVILTATGTVSGKIFLRDRVTPVAGAKVSLLLNTAQLSVLTTTTDATGNYSFVAVPVGDFTVDATQPDTGDRGRLSSRVTTASETRILNVPLLGQGAVTVTARTPQGLAVSGAVVTLNSSSLFGGIFNAVTDAAGMVIFPRVFNGDFNVQVVKGENTSRISAAAQGTVANSAAVSVDMTLTAKPIGRIVGVVNKGVAANPVAGVTVQLVQASTNAVSQQVVTGLDGSFAFASVEGGSTSWRLIARINDRVRSQVDSVQIVSDGETVTRNLAILGIGKVTGRTLDAAGQPMAGMSVEVNHPDPVYGGRFATTSQFDGSFVITDVPAGKFQIRANNNTYTLQAQSSGDIRFDGDVVSLDLNLVDSTVTMPITAYDANANSFTVQGDGSLSNGTRNVFGSGSGADTRAARLELLVNNVAVPFVNGDGSTGRLLMNNQLVEVDELNQASGLFVTRRTYIPQDGYFARHLEVLENRGTTPVTVGVRITSRFSQGVLNNRVVDSTNGDAVIDVSDAVNRDRWVVIDDERDADPFEVDSTPATAVVFDGAGGATQVSNAGVQTIGAAAKLTYEWTNITVPPGQSVALMHFTAQQLGRISAREAALRLAQVPPEALAGLSASELAAIRNFNVPADGLSQVEALPSVLGTTVAGRVLSGDGQAPIANANVVLQGLHPLYGRKYTKTTNSAGEYTFATGALGMSGVLVIAQDRVRLQAIHPQTLAYTAATIAPFVAGKTALTQDLIFVNTGNLRGVVKRQSGALVNSGQVYFDYQMSNGTTRKLGSNIAADGSYIFTGINPGSYWVNASQPHPQGKPVLTAIQTQVAIPAAETTVQDLVLEATGSITGVIYNAASAPVPGVTVRLDPDPITGSYRTTHTDTGGRYRFDDVATGSHVVQASGNNGLGASDTADVVKDTAAVKDLTLGGLATARVRVLYQRGVTAPNSYVRALSGATGYTDGSGVVSLTLRVGNTYEIQALHPDNSYLISSITATLANNGDTEDYTITLPAAGSLSGTVVRPDGSSLAAGVPITLRKADNRALITTGSTDAAGRYEFRGLAIGSYLVIAEDRPSLTYAEGTGDLTEDGQETPVNLQLQDNRIALPTKLYDGNNFGFNVAPNGGYEAIMLWQDNYYNGERSDIFTAAAQLEINGEAFTGDSSAYLEGERRQLAISQAQAMSGLQVTRKIFVPVGGYFARYLEVLSNPSNAPITVKVNLKHKLIGYNNLQVVDTSSGDTTLTASGNSRDRWVMLDDGQNADPFTVGWGSISAAISVVADNQSAAQPDQMTYTSNAAPPVLDAGWSSVTVPANGRLVLMHFDARQINQAGARYAAERLSKLPPEALQFLLPEELSAITNFSVPQDGVSQVEPLPSMLGKVSGKVFEGNGTTPVPNMSVNVRSTHPLFGRTWTSANNSYYCGQATYSTLYTSATGDYSITGHIAKQHSLLLPVDYPVEVKAASLSCENAHGHPFTSVPSPVTTASFKDGTAQANIVFETGILTGTVIGPNDYGASSGNVSVRLNQNQQAALVPLAADGTYVIPGMPAGTYTLNALVYHNEGTNLTGSRSDVVMTVGQTTVVDIPIQPTGSLTGVVTLTTGEPVVNATVQINSNDVTRSTKTDSLGRYTLSAVPIGPYSLNVTDPRTQAVTQDTVIIMQQQATTKNVVVVGAGSIALQVKFARGVAAPNANVYLTSAAVKQENYAGRTDSQGQIKILVPVGTYSLRVTHPDNTGVKTVLTGAVLENNQAQSVVATLPALASVQLTVLNADLANAAVSGATVTLTTSLVTSYGVGSTNGSGQLLLTAIPEGAYQITAQLPASGITGSMNDTIAAADDGKVLTRTLSLTASNDVLGVLNYGDARQLYAIDVVSGDRIDVRINGDKVGSVSPSYLVTAQVYDTTVTLAASGYGYGPNYSYQQYNQFNNLRNISVQQAGRYVIAVSPYGNSDGYVGGFRLHVEVNGVPVKVQPFAGAVLTGHVTNLAGIALSNQKLRIKALGTPGLNVEQATDAAGNYRVEGLPIGKVEIRAVSAAGAVSDVVATTTIDQVTTPTTLDVVLPVMMTINVQVNNGTGTPVASARVSFNPPGVTYYTDTVGKVSYTYTGSTPVTVTATHPSNSLISASQVLTPQEGIYNLTLVASPASIAGAVLSAAGAPIDHATVYLIRASDNAYLSTVVTDSSGAYTFPVVPTGVELIVQSSDVRQSASVMAMRRLTLTAGQVLTGINLVYPGLGSVSGRVTFKGSTPLVGYTVVAKYVIDQATGSTSTRTTRTDSNGQFLFDGNLPVGIPLNIAVGYRIFSENEDRPVSQTVTLSSAGGQAVANLNIDQASGASALLSVKAADGLAMPESLCEYTVTSQTNTIFVNSNDCNGTVLVQGLAAGGVAVETSVSLGSYGYMLVQGSTSGEALDGDVVALVTPVSVIKGKVTYPDNTVVSSLSVFVRPEGVINTPPGYEGGPNYNTYNTSNVPGEYRILGVPLGKFTVTAQDWESGLSQTQSMSLVSVSDAITADLVLPDSGTVTGIVRNAQGQPFANAPVYLRSSGLDLDRYVTSASDGSYTFTRVALGQIGLYVKNYADGFIGMATAALTKPNQTLVLGAALPMSASLSGKVRLLDGTPVAYSNITVTATNLMGPFGAYQVYTTADQNGNYSINAVPVGELDVWAYDSSGVAAGTKHLTATAGKIFTLDLTVGNQLRLPIKLEGADTSIYDIDCQGAIMNGGYQNATYAFYGSYYLRVSGIEYPCVPGADTRQNGREVVLPVEGMANLKVQRRVYAPVAGGYARYLDTFVNDGSEQIEVPIQVLGYLGSSYDTQLAVDPATTNNTYAVTTGDAGRPVVAHIFAGAGVSFKPVFNLNGSNISYLWNKLPVPAGGRVSLLHYVVQTAPEDTASASTRAQALSAGTEPGMFDGLDAADRTSVLNFVVPAP